MDRDTRAEDTLKEYIAFEFSPDVLEVLDAIRLLEAAWIERGQNRQRLSLFFKGRRRASETRKRIMALARALSARLIDSELVRNGGKLEGDVLKSAFNELTAIYHATNAHRAVRPPVLP